MERKAYRNHAGGPTDAYSSYILHLNLDGLASFLESLTGTLPNLTSSLVTWEEGISARWRLDGRLGFGGFEPWAYLIARTAADDELLVSFHAIRQRDTDRTTGIALAEPKGGVSVYPDSPRVEVATRTIVDELRDADYRVEWDTSPGTGQRPQAGRPRNPDDDWACREVWEKGRPKKEVYGDWKARIGARYHNLTDPRDSFKHAISRKRWKDLQELEATKYTGRREKRE